VLAELADLGAALQGELTGGREDEGLEAPLDVEELVDDGQAEGRRLAGAGAALDDEAAARGGGGVAVELDRGRLAPAELSDGAEDGVREVHLFEASGGGGGLTRRPLGRGGAGHLRGFSCRSRRSARSARGRGRNAWPL